MVEGVGGMIDMFNKWGVVTYTVTAYLVSYYGGLKIATMWHARFKTATLASVVAEKAHAVLLYISRAATLTYVNHTSHTFHHKLNSEGIDLNKALDLTDKRSVAAFNTFLNGTDTVLNLRDAVTGAEEGFNAMAEEMGDNVQGSLNTLSSTIEGVVLRFYESKGILRDLIDLVRLW